MSADREIAAVTAALLDQGGRINRLSRPLTIVAVVALMAAAFIDIGVPALAMLALGAIAGLAELYLAIRVGFDAALLRRLADDNAAPPLAALDAALVELRLLPAAKAGRPLPQRIAGARLLLLKQATWLAIQVLALLAAGGVAALR